MASQTNQMYTVGHSNQSFDKFVTLINNYDIEVIVDVRSHPFSKYSTQFDMDAIKSSLEQRGIKYLYLGKELGGMTRDEKYLDREGRVDYIKVAASQNFLSGISRILNGAKKFRLALMCGEENPTSCHRRHLIGSTLARSGIDLMHIRGDGRLETEADFLAAAEKENATDIKQLTLF